MTKHSKNNTASSIFSYAEYKRLDYGTKKQRLGNESMRRFDACALCLNSAREPVTCSEGHVFCKECVYTDLLTQKQDIERQKAKLAVLKKEAEEEKARAREAARERVLKEFEKGQLGLAAKSMITTKSGEADTSRGMKRKFDFDSTTAEALAHEAEEDALRQIEREQAEALRNKLPDFWLPSLTPTYASMGPPRSLHDIKPQTMCRGGNPPHSISLKKLVPINFTYFEANGGPSKSVDATPSSADDKPIKKEDKEAMCPSCKKRLSNNTLMFIMKLCGHVVCKTCTDTLVRESMQCVKCDKVLKKDQILELKREGTGFAGGGLAETSRTGIAFQG